MNLNEKKDCAIQSWLDCFILVFSTVFFFLLFQNEFYSSKSVFVEERSYWSYLLCVFCPQRLDLLVAVIQWLF